MPPVNDRARLSGRSAVSNGTLLFLQKTGIDYRTLTVRRFKDLIRSCSETTKSPQRATKPSKDVMGTAPAAGVPVFRDQRI
jgi:hypothetical protein